SVRMRCEPQPNCITGGLFFRNICSGLTTYRTTGSACGFLTLLNNSYKPVLPMTILLLLPTILCLVLTLAGCESTEQVSKIEIPSFDVVRPARPELVEIPSDPVAAIRALTVNLSKMDGYVRQLEMYVEYQCSWK
ncbi:MAG: hypothetical protein PHR01_07355, partial [Sphaerochaetaceae bacterium]|nr:hypothetical protein [Sphaerochaetaceae bacterium]